MTAESKIREDFGSVDQFDIAVAASKAKMLQDIEANPTGSAAIAQRERKENMARAETVWGLQPGAGAEIFDLAARLSDGEDPSETDE